MTQITINLPTEVAQRLRKAAADLGRTQSAVIIAALGVYLEEPASTVPVVASDPPPNVRTARRSKRPSARALPWLSETSRGR